jgi:hypothetical protein
MCEFFKQGMNIEQALTKVIRKEGKMKGKEIKRRQTEATG